MLSNLTLSPISSSKVTHVHYEYKPNSYRKLPIMIRITANRFLISQNLLLLNFIVIKAFIQSHIFYEGIIF
jgi:hypothetical protein